jgi:hypothetical protein
MRILPQVLNMLKYVRKIYNFYSIYSNASLQWFSFLISSKGVMILSILASILWIPIPIRIQQNYAGPA